MTEQENKLLAALVYMVRQYLQQELDDVIDSYAMSAGENAIETLAECGMIVTVDGGRILGRWSEAGMEVLTDGGYAPRKG